MQVKFNFLRRGKDDNVCCAVGNRDGFRVVALTDDNDAAAGGCFGKDDVVDAAHARASGIDNANLFFCQRRINGLAFAVRTNDRCGSGGNLFG